MNLEYMKVSLFELLQKNVNIFWDAPLNDIKVQFFLLIINLN